MWIMRHALALVVPSTREWTMSLMAGLILFQGDGGKPSEHGASVELRA